MDSFFYLVMFAGAVAGASTGLLGVYIVGMRMPFIGICISHSAMAGTIYSILLGVNPVLGPVVFSGQLDGPWCGQAGEVEIGCQCGAGDIFQFDARAYVFRDRADAWKPLRGAWAALGQFAFCAEEQRDNYYDLWFGFCGFCRFI